MYLQCFRGPLDGHKLEVELEDGEEIILGIRKVDDGLTGPGVWRWCPETKIRTAVYRRTWKRLVFVKMESN